MKVKKDAFNMSQINEETVLKHLETVNPGKSTGLDNLPAKFIRDGSSLDPHYKFIPPFW